MIEIEEYGNFKSSLKNKDKTQIILIHSSRNFKDYFTSLESRYNGKYNKIPNYTIDRNGNIRQLIHSDFYSQIFNNQNINKNSIIVCLENLGWLNKEPLKEYYVNWIGDIYNEKVYDKKWRDYFFWQPYTESQMISTAFLCRKLMKKYKISNGSVGNNTKINGIENFEGVVTRSNYKLESTDLNPAFDFDLLNNLIENE